MATVPRIIVSLQHLFRILCTTSRLGLVWKMLAKNHSDKLSFHFWNCNISAQPVHCPIWDVKLIYSDVDFGGRWQWENAQPRADGLRNLFTFEISKFDAQFRRPQHVHARPPGRFRKDIWYEMSVNIRTDELLCWSIQLWPRLPWSNHTLMPVVKCIVLFIKSVFVANILSFTVSKATIQADIHIASYCSILHSIRIVRVWIRISCPVTHIL